MWFKRIGLFLLTNILIVATIGIVTSVLGVGRYISQAGIDYSNLLVFCLLWGMVGSFISLLLSKFSAKMMMGVKVINPNSANSTERDLVNRVTRFARQANIAMPEVGIYESPEVNAFATGPTRNNSLVAVSTGLLNRMNSEELDGVLAHEVSHVANGDMVTMTLIQGAVNAFVMFLSRICAYALSTVFRGNSDDDEGPAYNPMIMMVLTFVFDIVFSILGSIVVAYFSRIREFRADAGGAKLAGRSSMVSALQNLQRMTDPIQDGRGEAMASLKISATKGGFMALFSTHPSLEDRIKALQSSRA